MNESPSNNDQAADLAAILARPVPRSSFPEQNADGIDLSLIRSNLRLSVEERIRRADKARWQAEQIRQLVRRV